MDVLASRDPERRIMRPSPKRAARVGQLDGVRFSSNAAAEIALRHGLSHVDFREWAPSGKRGYTAADVEDLIERIRRDKMGHGYEVKG